MTNGNLHVKRVMKEFFELVAEDWVNLQQKGTMAVWFWQTHFNFIPGKSSVSLVGYKPCDRHSACNEGSLMFCLANLFILVSVRKKIWGKQLHLSSLAFYEDFLFFSIFLTAIFLVKKRCCSRNHSIMTFSFSFYHFFPDLIISEAEFRFQYVAAIVFPLSVVNYHSE